MYWKTMICAAAVLLPTITQAADINITSVKVERMTTAHLCQILGGQGKDPKLTIRHDNVADVRIRIRMYDNVSNGRTVNHNSTSVMSNASGVTTVSYNFLPPCNTTGNSVSSYKFRVSGGGPATVLNWAGYDSAKRRIVH